MYFTFETIKIVEKQMFHTSNKEKKNTPLKFVSATDENECKTNRIQVINVQKNVCELTRSI